MSPQRTRLRRNEPQRHAVRLAARRRKRRVILGILGAILLTGLIGGTIYLTHLPQFMIQTVEVHGAYDVPDTIIKKYVASVLDDGKMHLFSPRTIFAYPKVTITAGLREQLPRLATVTVSRPSLFSTTLLINVTERTPYAMWCANTGTFPCYDVDLTGFVYAPNDIATSTGYVTLVGGILKPEAPIGLYVAPEHFDEIKSLLSGFTTSGYEARTFSLLTGNDFEVVFIDGLDVRGSFDFSVDELISNLKIAMGSDSLRSRKADLEYIDLRFGNRVYFKFKGGE